jgi:hypothetical protein
MSSFLQQLLAVTPVAVPPAGSLRLSYDGDGGNAEGYLFVDNDFLIAELDTYQAQVVLHFDGNCDNSVEGGPTVLLYNAIGSNTGPQYTTVNALGGGANQQFYADNDGSKFPYFEVAAMGAEWCLEITKFAHSVYTDRVLLSVMTNGIPTFGGGTHSRGEYGLKQNGNSIDVYYPDGGDSYGLWNSGNIVPVNQLVHFALYMLAGKLYLSVNGTVYPVNTTNLTTRDDPSYTHTIAVTKDAWFLNGNGSGDPGTGWDEFRYSLGSPYGTTNFSPPTGRISETAIPVSSRIVSFNPWHFSNTNTIVSSNLINEGSGGSTYDAIPNSTPYFKIPTDLGPYFSMGISSGCFSIQRPVQDDMSLCIWFRSLQTGGGAEFYAGFPLYGGDSAGAAPDFGVALCDNGKFAFGANTETLRTTNSYNDGRWHFGVATREKASGRVTLYVDNKLQVSAINSSAINVSLNANAILGLAGDFTNEVVSQIDVGPMDIFNVVLTPDQIRALYHKNIGDYPLGKTKKAGEIRPYLSRGNFPTIPQNVTETGNDYDGFSYVATDVSFCGGKLSLAFSQGVDALFEFTVGSEIDGSTLVYCGLYPVEGGESPNWNSNPAYVQDGIVASSGLYYYIARNGTFTATSVVAAKGDLVRATKKGNIVTWTRRRPNGATDVIRVHSATSDFGTQNQWIWMHLLHVGAAALNLNWIS